MKKAALLFFLGLLAIFTSAFSIGAWKDSVYEQIKTETIKGLKESLHWQVSVGSVDGLIVGQVVFRDVDIPGLVTAKSVAVDYNLITFLYKRDIVPAISKITVNGGSFKVDRDQQGHWSVLSILPAPAPNAPPPPPFRPKLFLKDCQVQFTDRCGWQAKRREFIAGVTEVNGSVSFQKKDRISFSLAGQSLEPLFLTKVKGSGWFNLRNGKFNIDVFADKLNLAKWTNYVLPKGPYQLKEGTADLNLKLSPGKTKGWPVAVKGSLQTYNLAGAVDRFPFTKLNGLINFADDNLTIEKCSAALSGLPVELHGRLSHFTDPSGQAVLLIKPGALWGQKLSGQISLSLAQKLLTVRLDNLNVYNGRWQGVGSLNFDRPVPALSLEASFVDLNVGQLAQGAPGSSGRTSGRLKLTGPLNAFRGSLQASGNQALIMDLPLQGLTAEMALKDNNLRFDVRGSEIIARGVCRFPDGLVQFDSWSVQSGRSLVSGEGQIGWTAPTRLIFRGNQLRLTDLKTVNLFLPKDLQDPVGTAEVSGEISGQALNELTLKMSLKLDQVKAAEIIMPHGELQLEHSPRRLKLAGGSIELSDSKFTFDYDSGPEKLSGNFLGTLNLRYLRKFFPNLGSFDGLLGLNLRLDGSPAQPEAVASFWLQNGRLNTIDFDLIKGGVSLVGSRLTIDPKIEFSRGTDRYELTGKIELSDLDSDLSLKVIKADLGDLVDLGQKIQGEFARRAPLAGSKVRLDPAAYQLGLPPFSDALVLYNDAKPKTSFLNRWLVIAAKAGKSTPARPEKLFGGDVNGELRLRGKQDDLAGDFSASVANGSFRNYQFDGLAAGGTIKKQKLWLSQFELNEGQGRLTAAGYLDFSGRVKLGLAAADLPLDILRLLFDRQFAGTFNLQASVEGQFADPRIVASADSRNARLGSVAFDEIALAINKNPDRLLLDNCRFSQGRARSVIYGEIPMNDHGQLKLTADLKNNAVGLINLLTDQVEWRSGQAAVTLEANGTLLRPQLRGNLLVSKGVLFVKALDSEIRQISGEAGLDGYTLTIPSLTGLWQGPRTKNYQNYLSLSGSIILNNSFTGLDLDLTFTPTWLYADFPNFYSGAVKVNSAKLSGPLAFDLSSGPTLSGQAEIENALITIPDKPPSGGKPAPLKFDLALSLNKNVYVAMGDVGTFDLSNIFLSLEIGSDRLNLSGSLAQPSLDGKVLLKRGTVTLFNREFSLLSVDAQQAYFPYAREKTSENTAIFNGDPGAAGMMPDINLTAKVDVENQELGPDGTPVFKKVTILTHLQGRLGATDEARSLRVNFNGFTEDQSRTPPEAVPANYSEQDIKVMLLPDFLKSMTGVNNGQNSGVNSNAVVADYLASRAQVYVFRGLERDLEQKLGLESLTLDYNFGKDIRQAIGANNPGTAYNQRPDWQVGFVKGLFDRLYVDVRYSQFAGNTNPAVSAFNYQLTYKLSRIWSIIYYREPISLQDVTSGYQKVTLKAGFSFW